ncbi:methyl-accepting chemotaxis protein [Actinoplanes sp. NPDC049802]|uniref:methyl-accepting chemotaxis protein n=1 Tax=Actinoplanes sp. NPDC049802 TaxID=3154742 RepID=UPI0033FE913A
MTPRRRTLRIRDRLLLLGMGSVLGTAAIMVGVGAWESGRFAGRAERQAVQENRADLGRTASDVATLVRSVGDEVQAGVNRNMRVARGLLSQSGGMSLSARTTTWTAVDQVTQQERRVTLPRMLIGGDWLGRDPDPGRRSAFVDGTTQLLGGVATVFQTMNDEGDLIRVATTVRNKAGQRALGTYIPAAGQDGTATPVVAAIKAGNPFRGVAQILDTWHITAYDPIKDADGTVIGALLVAVPQAGALENLTSAISARKIRENGWVNVYSTGKADRGRIVASSLDGATGRTDLTAVDAAGTPYVEQIVTQAGRLDGDATWHATYRLPGAAGAPAGDTATTVTHYAPYQWAIAVGGYTADATETVTVVQDGRRTMLLTFLIAALLLTVAGGTVAYLQARRIAGRVYALTTALSRLARRDLTVSVPAGPPDEIGQAGEALNTAVTELRSVMGEVTDATRRVFAAAQQVETAGGDMSASAEAAATQAGAVNTSAESVSLLVQSVAAGAEQMGASINEISSNAQDAAQAGRDGVGLTTTAAGVIAELRDSTTKINDVVRLIAGIAEQTNLLALNATIEAARAGETGKGFAVVAGEVKELAQETARATGDVTARVAAIETDTARAVTAIDAIAARIAQVNDYQTAIAAAVEQQAATTAEMARNITEAAAGSQDIAAGIGVVNGAVDGTRRSMATSHLAADELTGTARRLTGLVGRFTV